MKKFSLMIIILIMGFSSFGESLKVLNKKYNQDFQKTLERVDTIGNFTQKDFTSFMRIISEKPGEEKEILEALLMRRDRDEKFVLIIQKPDAQRGQGYLQIEDSVWFYDPSSRKFEHSSLKENIQNSDAKNSDLNRSSLSEDFHIINVESVKLGDFSTWKMTLEAKTEDVSYKKIVIWINKKNELVLKSQEYGFSGKLMRTTAYTSYKVIDGTYIPALMIIIDELNKGEKSTISFKNMSTKRLKDSYFSKAFLESVSR